MKTATTTAATMTTTISTDNKSIGSQYLAKYIRNVQQANEATAAQYEYRLSRFEKYIAMAYKEQQQQQNQELIVTLDHVINELKITAITATTRLILMISCLALSPTLKKRKI